MIHRVRIARILAKGGKVDGRKPLSSKLIHMALAALRQSNVNQPRLAAPTVTLAL